jgi:hypothetical protein
MTVDFHAEERSIHQSFVHPANPSVKTRAVPATSQDRLGNRAQPSPRPYLQTERRVIKMDGNAWQRQEAELSGSA